MTTSLAQRVPRVEVTVKRDAAAARGLSDAAVGQLVAQAYQGTSLGQVTIDGVQQKVQLSSGTMPPMTVEQLRALPVPGGTLADIADITQTDGAIALTRIDGARTVTVSGTPSGSDLGAITADVTERINALDVAGATFTIGGVSADQEEAFADLGLAVLAAIALVFLIMVVTFRSLIQPLILLVSVPFAFTGAIALLLITGKPLGVPALIGVLMLVGIVVTNAVVLIDNADLENFGPWPWSRYYLALLTDHLARQAPSAIAYDIIFAGRDSLDPALFSQIYGELDPATQVGPQRFRSARSGSHNEARDDDPADWRRRGRRGRAGGRGRLGTGWGGRCRGRHGWRRARGRGRRADRVRQGRLRRPRRERCRDGLLQHHQGSRRTDVRRHPRRRWCCPPCRCASAGARHSCQLSNDELN